MLKLTFKEDIVLQTTDGPVYMRRHGTIIVIDAPDTVKINRISHLPAEEQETIRERFGEKETY